MKRWRLAEQQKSYKDAPKTKKAADGDQVVIDFTGKIDGVEFEGGKAEDAGAGNRLGSVHPGLRGPARRREGGRQQDDRGGLPQGLPGRRTQGQGRHLRHHRQAGEGPRPKPIRTTHFAKSLGLESLDKLKELLRGQLEQETAGLTRTQMKRGLLDLLAKGHDFPVPPTMVEAEFEQIWQQLQQEAQREDDPALAMSEIEAEKDDYRSIAERRVRLGLLLSEIGAANGVEVTRQEMEMLIRQAAQQYREEDRQRFVDYVVNDAVAQAQLRAPLYEDKVVDFLFDKAEVTTREVTREELEAAIEAEDELEEAQAAKKPAAKKAPAKKEAAKPAEKKPAAKKAPAKEASAKKPAAAKKEAAAPAEKKPAAKKAPAKKPAAAKEAAKPAAEKAPAKKPAAKKPAAKKAPAKK